MNLIKTTKLMMKKILIQSSTKPKSWSKESKISIWFREDWSHLILNTIVFIIIRITNLTIILMPLLRGWKRKKEIRNDSVSYKKWIMYFEIDEIFNHLSLSPLIFKDIFFLCEEVEYFDLFLESTRYSLCYVFIAMLYSFFFWDLSS